MDQFVAAGVCVVFWFVFCVIVFYWECVVCESLLVYGVNSDFEVLNKK